MANRYKHKYGEAAVLNAIKGSRGIISLIASKLQCEWNTANAHTRGKHATTKIKAAFAAECELISDVAESVIIGKLNSIRQKQLLNPGDPDIIDDNLARWVLSHKAKDRGYADRTELTGANGVPIESTVVYLPRKESDGNTKSAKGNKATGPSSPVSEK